MHVASVFAWLDTDDEQRQKMLEIVKLFRDEDTVDELGIGSIRDAFSNALFPGTSVLHTTARYLLFVPWLVRDVARHGWPVERARRELLSRETRLVDSLLRGGETFGVIGRRARGELKTWPSTIYWNAVREFGIVRCDTSIDNVLRGATLTARRATEVTDGDDASGQTDLGIVGSLPPMPADLLTETTFALDPGEAAFLRDQIAGMRHQPLFAWLARHGTSADVDYIWEHPQYGDFHPKHQAQIDHARRFHHAIYGAAVLYNRELALLRKDELADEYTEVLEAWAASAELADALAGWDLTGFWATVRGLNHRVGYATERFVSDWIALVAAGDYTGPKAARLVRDRETALKGRRSRFVNPDALNAWTGGSGMRRLDYRWSVAANHLRAIYQGLEDR